MRAIERMLLSAGLDWHELAGAVGAEPEVIEKVVYRNPPQPKPDSGNKKSWIPASSAVIALARVSRISRQFGSLVLGRQNANKKTACLAD